MTFSEELNSDESVSVAGLSYDNDVRLVCYEVLMLHWDVSLYLFLSEYHRKGAACYKSYFFPLCIQSIFFFAALILNSAVISCSKKTQ